MSDDTLTAAKIAGLLAGEHRRRVVAALVLGAASVEDVVDVGGLEVRDAHDAIARLVSAGLVVQRDGALVLVSAAFGAAARDAAPVVAPAASDEERLLRTFVTDGRITSLPAQRSKRRVLLEAVAQDFEPGLKYTELEVNAIIGRWYDDHVTIRRYLIDEQFLDRSDGAYWRSGGEVRDL